MEDSEQEVKTKLKKAFCPPGVIEGNPCYEYIKYITFPWFGHFRVERAEGNGGDKQYSSLEELEADYTGGNLHPGDLKAALAKAINTIIQPVRDHFEKNADAKALLKRVRGYKSTR
jgi:tyrosyl-tRNA synthetase